MSPSQVQRSAVTAGAVDELPLRSFTALWAVLALFSGAFVVVAASGLSPGPARTADKTASASKGPTKREVRERQEHIAITERALELARKERKLAQPEAPASAALAAAPTTPAAAPAPPAPAPAAPAPDRKPDAPKTSAATPARAAGASAAAAPAAAPDAPAPAAPAPAKPAASGLDAMKADIGVSFE